MEETPKESFIAVHGHGLARLVVSAIAGYVVTQLVGKGYDAALMAYRSRETGK